MKTDLDVRLTLFSGILLFVLILLAKDQPSLKELWSAVSAAVSVTAVGRYVFVTWIWKFIPPLRKIHGVPFLEGEWKGKFVSTWSANPTGGSNATGDVFVRITQPNIFKIKVTQETDESISFSTSEGFETLDDGTIYLNFGYRNEPKATARAKSPISYGSARYRLDERNNGLRLHGDYFSDRKTTGDVDIMKTS